jgi:hypothetical protein
MRQSQKLDPSRLGLTFIEACGVLGPELLEAVMPVVVQPQAGISVVHDSEYIRLPQFVCTKLDAGQSLYVFTAGWVRV